MSKRPRKRQVRTSDVRADRSFAEILGRPYVPIAFFALLTAVYFYGFIFTGDVIFGSDTGAEFHKGKEPIAEKIAQIPPANWSRFMGGTPESAGLRAQYFPLHIIALFTSEHRYFGWRYVFAMFFAGYFTFLCVRGFGLHPLAGIVAGVAYMSAPAFLTFTQAGHFAKMSVIALFPLMYWALARGMHTRRLFYFLVLAGAVGIGIYTPHLQMVYFALWGMGFLFVYKLVVHYLSDRNAGAAVHRTLLAAGAICLGLAIGAEGVFPQYWNTKTATKRGGSEGEGAGYDYAASWSLHPEEIFALVIPEFGGFDVDDQGYHYWGRNPFKGNSEYVGIVPLFFALFALGRIRKQSHLAFLFGLFVFSVAYALGPHTPVHRLFYHLVPGVSVLRAPGMIAFLFSFALCALSAYGLHRLITGDVAPETSKKLGLIGGISAAVLLLFSFAPSALLSIWRSVFWTDMPAVRVEVAQASLNQIGQGALLAGLFVGILTVLSHLCIQKKIRLHVFVIALLPLCLMDTWRIDKLFLNYVNPNRVPPQERIHANAVAFLKQDGDLFRVLPLPDYRQVPLQGIDLVPGFNDFAIARYDHILKSGELQHPTILNLLNTRYFVSTEPFDVPWLEKVAERDYLHIYRNPYALPWFYLTPKYYVLNDEDRMLETLRDPAFDPTETALLEDNPGIAPDVEAEDAGAVELLAYNERQGRVELRTRATGPRILVISQNYHPHWRAFVNGEEKPLLRANYLWQGVALAPGEHQVELHYRDPIVATARWITLFGAAVLIAGVIATARKREEISEDVG